MSEMNAFEVYRSYLALKQHFTKDGYDYFKYNGKVAARASSFEQRRDRYYFEKLAKQRDPIGFVLANLVNDARAWVGDLISSESAESTYKSWLKRNQSLSYTFTEDLSRLREDFDENFLIEDGKHPPLMKLYLRGEICIESLIILMHLTGCYSRWNKEMEYDPVWKELSLKVRKYQPFIKYDLDKFRKITLDKFQ